MNDDQDDEPGVGQEPGDLDDASDVLDPVDVGEAEVAVEAVSDVVAVEQVGAMTEDVELLLDGVGDGRLSGTGEPGEPEHRGPLAVLAGPSDLVDLDGLPVDVVGPAQGEVQQPGGDGGVGEPVDEDEAAHVAVLDVGVERDRSVEAEVADADLVELEGPGRGVLQRGDVDLVLGVGHCGGDRAGAELEQVRPAREELLLGHPHEVALELVGDPGGRGRRDDDVAAGDVDLVGEGEGDGLAGGRLLEVALGGDDAGDGRFATRWQHADGVAGANRCRRRSRRRSPGSRGWVG